LSPQRLDVKLALVENLPDYHPLVDTLFHVFLLCLYTPPSPGTARSSIILRAPL
jgi:hypothetical protein